MDKSNTAIETKVCTSCGETKRTGEFHHFGAEKERVGKWCESCFQRTNGRRKRQGAS